MKNSMPQPSRAPVPFDPSIARKSFEALQPELEALPPDDIVARTVDAQAVAPVAVGVADFIAAPEVSARFAKLPKDEFDAGHVHALGVAAWALWYAVSELLSAQAAATNVTLPPELLARSAERKERMLKVIEYHVPEEQAETDSIREGSGHLDRASDMQRLAKLYAAHDAALRADKRWYRADDCDGALADAAEILRTLAKYGTSAQRRAQDLVQRAWTVLNRHYDEVRAAGLWLYRRDPARDEKFPSLVSSVRAARSSAKAEAPAPSPEAPAAPAPKNG